MKEVRDIRADEIDLRIQQIIPGKGLILLFYKNAITHKNFVKTEEKPTFYEELPDFDDAYNEILRKNEKQG